MTDAARFGQMRELFESLVDAEAAEVESRLRDVRRLDPGLADEVASLLQHHSRAGAFLARAAVVPPEDEILLDPGTLFGSYRIEREAGHGGMGRVYLATDTRLLRRVSVKIVRPELVAMPSARERLRREAQVAASIQHPAICAVYALEEIGGTVAVISEFVDGRTLREELAGGRLDAETLNHTFRALADALACMHERGVTHGDLKPENIMRSVSGQVKILDFGLARSGEHPGAGSLSELLAGTLTYMAPEQINGGSANARSDVFALGIVMYECAAGTHPFAAPTALATTARILEHEPAPLEECRSDLPERVTAAIGHCLRKASAERFPSGAALVEALATREALPPSRGGGMQWWLLHQLAVTMLYLAACVASWAVKEWDRLPATRWTFIAVGVLAAMGGIIRGHLLFTASVHATRLASERHRMRRSLLFADLLLALLVFADGIAIADARPVFAVLTMALAAGIAAAVLVIEPSTSAGAFGETDRA